MTSESPTCWKPSPLKAVVLEKVTDISGVLPVGHTFRWDYKTTADNEARKRAVKALLRDHPKENAMDWRIVK